MQQPGLACSRFVRIMDGMRIPRSLSQYPWVVVRIDCILCDRKGCYRLARLAARYGPEQTLDGLLADLANNCPWWRSNPRKYEPRCGARFLDLERNLPVPDHPTASVHRQRQPGREDLPNRAQPAPAWSGGIPMLSGWTGSTLVITCSRCGRRDSYSKTELLMKTGDTRLTDLPARLTTNCPHRQTSVIYDRCQAVIDGRSDT